MTKNFKFTIIVTTYNSENFIHRSIKSILNQEFNHEEIQLIIIDDSSTDQTVEKIKSLNLEDSVGMFLLLETDFNSGPGEARNIGILNQLGDYVIFIDSDDELLPNALSQLSANTAVMTDLIFYDAIKKFPNDQMIKYCKHANSLSNNLLIKLKAILSLESDDHVIFSAYRSSYLRTLSPFHSGFFEDIRFQAYAILQAKNVSHIGTPLYLKNSHDQQITSFMDFDKVIQYLECRISLHEELLSRFEEFKKDLEVWSNFGLRGAISLALNNMRKHYDDNNDFTIETKKVFTFLNERIDYLSTLVSNDLSTDLDYQAKLYYDTYYA
jgi:glycosyltransferase involved in cell wall biosynthesis